MKGKVEKEEREKRLVLIHEYEQWKQVTGRNSRKDFALQKGLDLTYLNLCLKWYHQVCKRSKSSGKKASFTRVEKNNKAREVVHTQEAVELALDAIELTVSGISVKVFHHTSTATLSKVLSVLGVAHVL